MGSSQIRFRAWDGERLRKVNTIGWVDESVDFVTTPRYSGPAEDFRLMQYTGLKDATGVEIYEGDICEEPYEEILGVVKFSEGKFIIVWDNSGDDLFEVSDEVRVVGNIYEHGYFVRGLEAE